MAAQNGTGADAALAEAVACRAPERVAEILMHNMWHFYNGDFAAAQAAIASLPGPLLDRFPVLRLAHPIGVVEARTDRPFASADFDDLLAASDPAAAGLLIMAQVTATRVSGDVAGALSAARRLRAWIQQNDFAAMSRDDGPLWLFHHQIASTFLLAGDTVEALRQFGIARQIGIASGSQNAARSATGRIAIVQAIRGALTEAELALHEAAAQPAPSGAYASSSYGSERAAAALISVERLADDVDERIAGLATFDNSETVWPLEVLAKARLAIARHEPAEAIEQSSIAAATHPIQAGAFSADVIDSTTITALLALGDLAAADRAIQSARSRGPMTRLAAVEAAIHHGDYMQAREDLRYISTRAALPLIQRAEVDMLTARVEALKTGQIPSRLAEQIADAVARRGYRRLATTLPAPLIPLIRGHLAPASAHDFDSATAGLRFASSGNGLSRALTDGERRVLDALTAHETVADIARALHVSPNTIKTQLRSLYRKMGVSSRADAIAASGRVKPTDAAARAPGRLGDW
ncbi:LuxR C-terminal-related transcriptional regulator [Gryllotalpicola reticulitermitis]|uniref:LuxR C-terminal-related transcriptional regulator n=1 Tax=Gryllotalpicola reticulitermitis TaxID=1184153 RepID=A0ABV8Q4K1_9MICO